MPDRSTRTREFRAGAPFTAGTVTLLPIERIVTHAHRGEKRVWFMVSMEPYALVVRDAGGIRAVGADATALSLDRLREEIPELEAVLASI